MNGSVRANERPRGGASAEFRAGRALATYAGDSGGGGGGVHIGSSSGSSGRAGCRGTGGHDVPGQKARATVRRLRFVCGGRLTEGPAAGPS